MKGSKDQISFSNREVKKMRKKLIMIGLTLAMLFSIVGYTNQAQARTTVSFNLFFDALAPYGNWVSTPDYGYAWSPTNVGQDWEPYTNGHWVWTDYGWTWVSYEPWGWAPYHYGRWVYTDYDGWVWIPGTRWAPAWVTWYEGSDYVGWAPLPPDEGFSAEVGISFSNYHYYAPREAVFVPSGFFLSTRIRDVIVPRSRNVTIINNTRNINNITIVNNRVINRGLDVNFVERATRTRVQKVNLVDRNVDNRTVIKGGGDVNQIKGKDFYVYRPDVVKKGNETPVINRKFENNRNEAIQKQGNPQNPANQGHPAHKKNVENNPAEIRNRNNQVINPNQPNNKEIKKEQRIENRNNPQNPNQQYPIRWDNNGSGNHSVKQNTVQSHSPAMHSENHPVYRNMERQFSPKGSAGNAGNFKQFQGATNNSPRSYPHSTNSQKPHDQSNLNTKEQKLQKRDSGQHSNNKGNVDSRRNHKQTNPNG
jgi:hypothetical protein